MIRRFGFHFSMLKGGREMKNGVGFIGGLVLVAFLVAPVSVRASGIPVIDIAGLMQSIQQVIHMIEQVNQLKEQVETAKSQLETAEKDLERMSSVRGMGGIIDSAYDNDLDIDYEDILRAANIKTADDYGLSGRTATIYNDKNRAAAQWKGRSDKFLNQAVERFNELRKLVVKVNQAPDAKDILDLQGRIQAEETLLQNEMLKLQMMQSQAQAEHAMNEQRAIQMHLQMKNGENTRF